VGLTRSRETTAALPGVIADANALRASAWSYQTAATPQATPGISISDPRMTPIAGVDLPTYAWIVKTAVNGGQPAGDVAGKHGVSMADWQQAASGWPARMHGDMSLAVYYGQLYGSAA
jgi:hypothetical protein